MNGCSQCGRCCIEIWCKVRKDFYLRNGKLIISKRPGAFEYPSDIVFIKNYWRPLYKDGKGIRFWCDFYNAITHKCMIENNKPMVCKRYPYYGDRSKNERKSYCTYSESN